MAKGLVSIITPSRNERFLQKTILDLLVKATQEIEVIAVLDGYWPPKEEIVDDPRVIYIHFSKAKGMRNAINSGVAIAKGEFILKCDAHCMFAKGFDEVLKADCGKNMVCVPTRLRLEPEKWVLLDVGKPPMNYLYLTYPTDPAVWGGKSLQGREWTTKNKDKELAKKKIDDAMTAQGSCWLMRKSYFEWLEIYEQEKYGTFTKEFQEIGLKVWLSGGRIIRNKKTWYAHLHKGKKYGRGYRLSSAGLDKGAKYVNRWIYEKMWDKQIYDFEWLIEKFWPIPNWPENWKEELPKLKDQLI